MRMWPMKFSGIPKYQRIVWSQPKGQADLVSINKKRSNLQFRLGNQRL